MAFCDIVESIDRERLITKSHVKRVGDRYGLSFPESLVQYFLDYNGATLKDGVYIDKGCGIHQVVPIRWDSYDKAWGANVMDIMDQYRELGAVGSFIKRSFVPFACDQFGNEYVCDTCTEMGAVYLTFFNLGPDNMAIYVADSLVGFLNGIEVERGQEVPSLELNDGLLGEFSTCAKSGVLCNDDRFPADQRFAPILQNYDWAQSDGLLKLRPKQGSQARNVICVDDAAVVLLQRLAAGDALDEALALVCETQESRVLFDGMRVEEFVGRMLDLGVICRSQ